MTVQPGEQLAGDVAAGPALASSVRHGLGWSIVNTVVSRAGSLVSGIILARILAPEDYGSFAVALVVLTAVLSMNELGVSLAIVRSSEDPARIAPTVGSMALASSVVLYALIFMAAPSVAVALNAPQAGAMIRVVGVCVLFDAVAAVSAALIARSFLQERRLVIDLVGFLLGTGLSVGLAVAGFGAWSMIWGLVLSNLISSATSLLLAPRRFRPGFDRTVVRELLRFGMPLAGSSLLLFAMLNVDYIVVGHVLGAEALGLYLMAFNLSSWPVSVVSTTIRRVSLAGFSRTADVAGASVPAFTRSLRSVLVAALAVSVPLAVFAEPILRILYGDRWTAAAPALQFLSVLAVGRILAELAYDYFISVDRNVFNLMLHVLWLAALLVALVVGAKMGGVGGVGAAHAAVVVLVVLPLLVGGLKSSGVTARALWTASRRPLLAALPMVAVAAAVAALWQNAWAVVLVGGPVCVVTYLALNRPVLRELRLATARSR